MKNIFKDSYNLYHCEDYLQKYNNVKYNTIQKSSPHKIFCLY